MKYIYIIFIILLICSCVNKKDDSNISKNGFYHRYFYIHNDTVRYEYNYENGMLNGELNVLVNNHLIKSQNIEYNSAEGKYSIFFLNGKIMFDGQAKDGGLYFIKEFDERGVLKNEKVYYQVFVESKDEDINIYFDFFDLYKFWESRDFAYAFYKITDTHDTINLMENNFETINIDTSLYIIPFTHEHKGDYLLQFAITTMEDYEYWAKLYSLKFGFDEKGIIYSDDFKVPPIVINLKYPYTLIFDTLLFNNYNDLLDKVDLNLEHLTPKK